MGDAIELKQLHNPDESLVWQCDCGAPTFYAHEDGRLECAVCGVMQVGHDATVPLDAVLERMQRELPGWVVANLGQDDNRLWWAELRQGGQTSFGHVALITKQPSAVQAFRLAIDRAKQLEAS